MASYAIASLLRDHRAPVDSALGWIQALSTLTGPRPTHALWLRIPPPLAAHRAAARAPASLTTAHRGEHQAYLNRVHHAYQLLAEHDPQLTALDVADLNPQYTHHAIHHALSRHSRTATLRLHTDCASRHLTGNYP
jgi:thymidylate kinase